jgi:hypothetical protein
MTNDTAVFLTCFVIFAPQLFMVWRIWRSDQSVSRETSEQPILIPVRQSPSGRRVTA